jgi:ribose-phosphate pyrophosphokinase
VDKPIGILATPYMADMAQEVQRLLPADLPHVYNPVKMRVHSCGEVTPYIRKNIRHQDIFLFHSMFYPDINTATLSTFFLADAAVGASAKNITLVLPFMSYQRQDRKDKPRTAISARTVFRALEVYPNVSIMTLDMHARQLQAAYKGPIDEIPAWLPAKPYLEKRFSGNFDNVVLVGSDASALKRVEELAAQLNADNVGYIKKKRDGNGKPKAEKYIGPRLKGRMAISIDDMIDSAGTQEEVSTFLCKADAMLSVATHGIFSTKEDISAFDRLRRIGMQVAVTNSIPRSAEFLEENKDVLTGFLPIEPILADAIYRSMTDKSVSAMWTGKEEQE